MGKTFTIRCARPVRVGIVRCMRMESLVSGAVVATEHLRIEKDGVYRYKFNDTRIHPPLKILQLAPESGAKWKVKSRVIDPNGNEMTFQCNFSMKVLNISVFGVVIKDVIIVTNNGFNVAGVNMQITCYYSKGIGMIQQNLTIAGNRVRIRLKKYTPAKAKQKNNKQV